MAWFPCNKSSLVSAIFTISLLLHNIGCDSSSSESHEKDAIEGKKKDLNKKESHEGHYDPNDEFLSDQMIDKMFGGGSDSHEKKDESEEFGLGDLFGPGRGTGGAGSKKSPTSSAPPTTKPADSITLPPTTKKPETKPNSNSGAGINGFMDMIVDDPPATKAPKPKPTLSSDEESETDGQCIAPIHRETDFWDRLLMLLSFPIVFSCIAMQTRMFQ